MIVRWQRDLALGRLPRLETRSGGFSSKVVDLQAMVVTDAPAQLVEHRDSRAAQVIEIPRRRDEHTRPVERRICPCHDAVVTPGEGMVMLSQTGGESTKLTGKVEMWCGGSRWSPAAQGSQPASSRPSAPSTF